MTDRVEHPPHLAVLPFAQLDQQVRFARRRLAQRDCPAASRYVSFDDPAADRDGVQTRHRMRRIGNPVGQPRVRGQQEQARRRQIEPANRNQALAVARRARRRRSAAPRDRAASSPPRGACERESCARRAPALDRRPPVAGRVPAPRAPPRFARRAVHAHPAGPDGLDRLGPRQDPELRQGTAQRDAADRRSFRRVARRSVSSSSYAWIRRVLVPVAILPLAGCFQVGHRDQAESRRQRHHRTAAAAHRTPRWTSCGRSRSSAAETPPTPIPRRKHRRASLAESHRPRRHLRVVDAGEDRDGAGSRLGLRVHRHHEAAHQRAAATCLAA